MSVQDKIRWGNGSICVSGIGIHSSILVWAHNISMYYECRIPYTSFPAYNGLRNILKKHLEALLKQSIVLKLKKCNGIIVWPRNMVGFIYTFWSSLSSTSSILEYGFYSIIICKWLVQKDFNNISASFKNIFAVVFT